MMAVRPEVRRAALATASWWSVVLAAALAALVASGCSSAPDEGAASASQAATTRTVIPRIDASMKARLRQIYLAGQSLGNRAAVFSKVGDTLTTNSANLTGLGCGRAVLDAHTELAPTITYFGATTFTGRASTGCTTVNPFTLTSYAAGSGWTTASALATVSRSGCPSPYNTALRCELHLTRPSVALIMLGTYDLAKINNVTTFTNNLTRIVTDTINAGVIPVLSTIPPRLDNATLSSRVASYNNAILSVAAAQQVPVWDYWVAMTAPSMIHQGMSSGGVLPSIYNTSYPVTFTSAALAYGYNQRNMTALQVLEHVRSIVIADGAPDPDPSADAGADATADATADTSVDTSVDTTADATTDASVDATADATADATIDTTADTTADATIDTTADATTDVSVDTTADATTDGGAAVRTVIPVIDASMKSRLRTIYLSGQSLGNRAAVFSKVGDGITASGSFLSDIGCGAENLGTHTELATTISYFRATSIPGRTSSWCGVSNSFSLDSVAAQGGWTTGGVLAGVTRSDCPSPYDTMLRCELHLTKPSIALILIGTNDLELVGDLAAFTNNLTRIVTETVNAGVIPVLSTLPPRTDSAALGAQIPTYNDAIFSVAAAQQVPVWDYWLAMTAPTMVNQGLDADGLHPSVYLGSAPANFTDPGLAYGYNQRNMTAVQVLEHVRAIVIDDGSPDTGTPYTGGDAGADAAADSALDATTDTAADGTIDATTDTAADSTIDATTDAVTDAAADSATDTTDAWVGTCDASTPLIPADTEAALAARRQSCEFTAGARVADTLGVTADVRSRIPIDHVVILMQENHSFDQYFGTMAGDVDRIPASYTNPDLAGNPVHPAHYSSTCPADPPHQWDAVHDGWDNGAMDGFLRSGLLAGISQSEMMGYYTSAEIPFYYWLYGRFAMSDRYFASVLSGTWATRDFAYLASSYGVRNTGDRVVSDQPSIFDRLSAAGVSWGVYTDGGVRQDCIGWTNSHAGVHGVSQFYADLAAGTLPSVVYLDAIDDATDEHPPTNIHLGETFVRNAVTGVMASPLWSRIALLITYDEAGGFFDHVPPPSTCYPHAPATAGYDTTDLNRLGIRVPFVVVSPWAKSRYVSHVVHDHTSTLRFVEALFDLPALTARDANAAALFDMFDFSCPQSLNVTDTIPAAGTGGCP